LYLVKFPRVVAPAATDSSYFFIYFITQNNNTLHLQQQ
jgi:hypothetical protein